MQEPKVPGYKEPHPMGGSDPDPLSRQVIMTDVEKMIEDTAEKLYKEWQRKTDYVYDYIWSEQPRSLKDQYCLLAKQILAGLDVYVIDKTRIPNCPFEVTLKEQPLRAAFELGASSNKKCIVPLSEIIKEVEK